MKPIALILLFGNLLTMSFSTDREAKDFAFHSGEKLVYKIYYNWNFVWLPAGDMTLEIKDEPDAYHIEVTGKTYPSYEWFYKVRDKYHSYIDKKTGLPKLYIRDIQQGNYRHYEKIVFDYKQGKALSYTGKTINDLKVTELVLDKDYYDMISCLYFLRNMDIEQLKKYKRYDFNIILDNEKYSLALRYQQDENKLEIDDNGVYNTFLATGDVIEGKVFRKGVQLNFWISNDSNVLPVMMESPVIVGSIKGILSSYANLKYPFKAKIK